MVSMVILAYYAFEKCTPDRLLDDTGHSVILVLFIYRTIY